MTLATYITLLRLVLVPVFVVCLIFYYLTPSPTAPSLQSWRYAAFLIFTVAAVSDLLDGYLARHWNQASPLGALLDPIADKLLLLAALIMLGVVPYFLPQPYFTGFPLWFPIVIVGRDAILLTGYLILRRRRHGGRVEIHPHLTGKLSTFLTFLAIGAVLLQLVPLIYPLTLCGGFLALISTVIYVQAGLLQLGGTA